MITTEQLVQWRDKILKNRTRAQQNALANRNNKAISEYYVHQASVCGYQASIVDRLILYSQNFDKE